MAASRIRRRVRRDFGVALAVEDAKAAFAVSVLSTAAFGAGKFRAALGGMTQTFAVAIDPDQLSQDRIASLA